MYRNFLKANSVAQAERCAEAHAPELVRAQKLHGVDASVVAAIMHVETHCGRNTGNAMVLHRLARLAMANEPHNVARNLARNTGKDGRIDPELGRARPLARALPRGDLLPAGGRDLRDRAPAGHRPDRDPRLGRRRLRLRAVPPDELRRASAPTATTTAASSLYEPADAAASCARFLASYGWKPGISRRSAARSSGTTTAPTPTSTPCWVSPIASTRAACSPMRNPKRESTEARVLPVSVQGGPVDPVVENP